MRMRQALETSSTGQLGRLAAAWGLAVESGTLRRELIELVAARLDAAIQEEATWTALSDAARDVLESIARAGGRLDQGLLLRRFRRRLAVDEDTSDEEAERRIVAAVGDLADRGLLVRVFESVGGRRDIVLVVPDEVLAAARRCLASAQSAPPLDAAPVPVVARFCTPAFDLFAVASALRREAWNTAARGMAGRKARTVGQVLAGLQAGTDDGPGEPGRRWRFWLWVAQRAGWITSAGWPLPDDEQVERLLADPSGLARHALAAAGLRRERSADGETASAERLHHDALQLVGEIVPGRWATAARLLDWLAAELADAPAADAGARRADPRARVRRTLERWLEGRWFWLGLIQWAAEPQSGAGALPVWTRVSTLRGLHQTLRLAGATTEPPAPAACVAEEGLRLLAPSDADLAALYRCERYLAYTGGAGVGRQYTLSAASFARGVRLGGDATELLDLLGRLARQPVPPAWEAAIRGWASGPERLRLSARLVLTASSEASLDAAIERPAAAAAIDERLTASTASVRPEYLSELLTDLAEAGLPVEIDPGVRAAPGGGGRSAALAGDVAEAAWVALEALRRVAPEVVRAQRDLQAAQRALAAALPAATLEALERRAITVVGAIAEHRTRRAKAPRGKGAGKPAAGKRGVV